MSPKCSLCPNFPQKCHACVCSHLLDITWTAHRYSLSMYLNLNLVMQSRETWQLPLISLSSFTSLNGQVLLLLYFLNTSAMSPLSQCSIPTTISILVPSPSRRRLHQCLLLYTLTSILYVADSELSLIRCFKSFHCLDIKILYSSLLPFYSFIFWYSTTHPGSSTLCYPHFQNVIPHLPT